MYESDFELLQKAGSYRKRIERRFTSCISCKARPNNKHRIAIFSIILADFSKKAQDVHLSID